MVEDGGYELVKEFGAEDVSYVFSCKILEEYNLVVVKGDHAFQITNFDKTPENLGYLENLAQIVADKLP